MIRVTRLNGTEFVVNADMIKFIEETPDTVVTLTTSEKIVIRETMDEVMKRAIEYGRLIRTFPAGK